MPTPSTHRAPVKRILEVVLWVAVAVGIVLLLVALWNWTYQFW